MFMQRAFREGGKAGCARLRPCGESRKSQNTSNSAAKRFHVKDRKSEQCWLHRSFYPTLGKHVAKKCPSSSDARCSPERGDSTSMNDSNPRAAVLGEKAMSVLQTDA